VDLTCLNYLIKRHIPFFMIINYF